MESAKPPTYQSRFGRQSCHHHVLSLRTSGRKLAGPCSDNSQCVREASLHLTDTHHTSSSGIAIARSNHPLSGGGATSPERKARMTSDALSLE